jgi:hypothetical protein
MKTVSKLALNLVLIFVSLTSPTVLGQYQCTGSGNNGNCPPCYYNQTHQATHGTTTDGRKIVNVYINNTGWGTGSDIATAVSAGRSMWNNATDTTSNPGTTIRPPYYFQDGQSTGSAQADVIVTADPNVAYADTVVSSHPATMRINPTWWATLNSSEKAAIIAHELAHPRGLGNAFNGASSSGCETSDSIMRGLNTSNKPVHLTVEERDVFQMNRYYNSPAQCCANVNSQGTIDNECPDADGDGLTSCGGDCDDSDPYNDCAYRPTYSNSYCYSYYLVTDHFISYDGGQTYSYWYSDYQYMGSQCFLTE